ncbi:hypothetical protein HMPREF9075_01587 [Capnocytophaga sp. oral taxon 332 str. F0381]|nr:hypothetical protein HMPREF9075_01587 [Capnocytophaga sp. oral taxon 332 str. F0381]
MNWVQAASLRQRGCEPHGQIFGTCESASRTGRFLGLVRVRAARADFGDL